MRRPAGDPGMVKDLYRYIWKVSARHQVLLSLLAVAIFLIELAPLELQRRIVNGAVEGRGFEFVGMLCLVYVGVELVHGGLKLVMNVYRGSVAEAANKRLRLQMNPAADAAKTDAVKEAEEGVKISMIVAEVESVGNFVGSSFSEPLLNAGILLSILGYMVFTQPWMALVALLIFFPQFLFIPFLQEAINRRTKRRIETMRALSVDIVDEAAERSGERSEQTFRRRIGRVYELNMQIFRRKYGMNFLMNLFYHLGIIGILAVGGWLVLQGKTEVGTIVAFISGLSRMNDPWGDLVDFFRNLTNTGLKYRMIAEQLDESR
ncbi:MAG TPA: ABC transporter ATP-binding protein, partial [Burkholderiales bacterium]|nr:ABC transporter ATP-binding protein [Burkholderiales bacterium]